MFVFMLSCVPYSDNPLTDPNEQTMDSTIYGTWFWKDENESGYIHIGLDEKSKFLRVIMLDFDSNGELGSSEFYGHTSSLGENRYLNLKWVLPADEMGGYTFVKYVVREETLGISLMDIHATEKAIKYGFLQGEVNKTNWSMSVHINEDQKRLQQFILQNDKELFKNMKYLPKLKLPNNS